MICDSRHQNFNILDFIWNINVDIGGSTHPSHIDKRGHLVDHLPTPLAWQRISIHSTIFFAFFRQPGALQILSGLYCGRAHHLWRDPTILPWLEKNVHAVLDLVEADAAIIKEAAEKRLTRYQGTPRNIYRHVILSDIKDATTSLPRVSRCMQAKYIQLGPMKTAPLLNKHYWNEGTLTGQNLSLECC